MLTPRRSQTASRLAPKSSPAGKPSSCHSARTSSGVRNDGRVVDDRAATEAGTRDQADALVVGRRRAAAAVEAPEAGPLGAVEVALRPVAARLEHDDVEPRRREHGRGDASARARADHADVALQLEPAADVERLEARRGRVVAHPERPRVADLLPAAGKHVRERERRLPQRLEAGAHQRDRAVAPGTQHGLAPSLREPREPGQPRAEEQLQPLPLRERQIVLERVEDRRRHALLDGSRGEGLADRVQRAHGATLRAENR